jgi:hypothetical protein
MEVGNGGMSTTEQQAIFSLYGLIKTPLYIGADVTTLSGARNAFLALTVVRWQKPIVFCRRDRQQITVTCIVIAPKRLKLRSFFSSSVRKRATNSISNAEKWSIIVPFAVERDPIRCSNERCACRR